MERSKTSGRSDDSLAVIKRRFDTFRTETVPVLSRFAKEGLVREVDGEGTVEEVWGRVKAVLEEG